MGRLAARAIVRGAAVEPLDPHVGVRPAPAPDRARAGLRLGRRRAPLAARALRVHRADARHILPRGASPRRHGLTVGKDVYDKTARFGGGALCQFSGDDASSPRRSSRRTRRSSARRPARRHLGLSRLPAPAGLTAVPVRVSLNGVAGGWSESATNFYEDAAWLIVSSITPPRPARGRHRGDGARRRLRPPRRAVVRLGAPDVHTVSIAAGRTRRRHALLTPDRMAPGETNTSGYLICQTPPHRNREGGAVALEVTLNGHEDDQTPGIDDWGDRPWTGPWATPLTPAIDNLGYRRLPVAQHTGYVGATFSTTGVLFRYEHLCENAGRTPAARQADPAARLRQGAATKIECTYHEERLQLPPGGRRGVDHRAGGVGAARGRLRERRGGRGAGAGAATRRDCCEACARQNGCANFVHDAGAQRCVLLPHVPHHQHELYKTYGAEERGMTVRYGGLLVPNPETVAGVSPSRPSRRAPARGTAATGSSTCRRTAASSSPRAARLRRAGGRHLRDDRGAPRPLDAHAADGGARGAGVLRERQAHPEWAMGGRSVSDPE